MKKFNYSSNHYGLLAIFSDYPNNEWLSQQLLINAQDFFPIVDENDLILGTRRKKVITFTIEKKNYSFFTKGKHSNSELVYEINQERDPKNYFSDSFSSYKVMRDFSVLHELISNREAQIRYEKKFGRKISFEVPVGFFISKRPEDFGTRLVIFEYLEEILSLDSCNLSNEIRAQITRELESVGVTNDAAFKSFVDIIMTKDSHETRMTVIDSESWKIKK